MESTFFAIDSAEVNLLEWSSDFGRMLGCHAGECQMPMPNEDCWPVAIVAAVALSFRWGSLPAALGGSAKILNVANGTWEAAAEGGSPLFGYVTDYGGLVSTS